MGQVIQLKPRRAAARPIGLDLALDLFESGLKR
jgi:hypothetical protein